MVSQSRGEGGYRSPNGSGEFSSTLTALFPYGRYALSERVSVWGMAGYGEGTLTLTPEGQVPMRPDMDLMMGALGVRGVLLDGGTGGPTLAATFDAFAVRTSTDAVTGLAASEADVTRVRLALEGSQPVRLGGDAVLTPSLEFGLRHDGGDAETGFGAGLALTAPSRGLSAEIRARGLLTHEADGMREWGVSGTLAWDPAPDSDRGLSLSLSQTVGAQASGGADALLARPTLAGLGTEEDEGPLGRRLDARLGYGLGVFDDRWTATPELGLGLSDTDRELRLGGVSPSGSQRGSPSNSGWRALGARVWTAPRIPSTGWRWASAGGSWGRARAMRRSRCASRRRGAMLRTTTGRRRTRSGSRQLPAGEAPRRRRRCRGHPGRAWR